MKIEKLKSRNSISWIVIICMLIILYASYFLLYIPKQELLVQERGFRILEEYAKNIHEKKEHYNNYFKNYGAYFFLRDTGLNNVNFDKNSKITESDVKEVIDDLEKNIELKLDTSKGALNYVDNNEGNYLSYSLDSVKIKESIDKIDTTLQVEKNRALIPITIIMEGLKFDKLFENISLIDSQKVIYNTNDNVINNITGFKHLTDTISKTQGGLIYKMEIKGVDKHILFLPFNLANETFYLAGFITDKEFEKKTRTIDSQLLSLITGILLMLLIGIPILKIMFLGKKERLNVGDVYLSTISMMLGISILVLLFIATMKFYVVDSSTNKDRINSLSDSLQQNITSNFKCLYNLRDSVLRPDTLKQHEHWTTIQEMLNDTDSKYNQIGDSIRNDSSLFPFNEVIFINEKGKAIKMITKTPFSDLDEIDLSSRDYYEKLKKYETTWPLETDSTDGFYLESIKSYNTGNKEASISFKLKNKKPFGEDSAMYMAITSHFPALYDQVLPPGVAFTVINKEGQVLFHSDDSKNLHENFLVEIRHHPKIMGAIKYRSSETIKVTYNEKYWMARIVPLPNMPLYHITLLDLQYQSNKNTKIYLFTFYLLLATFFCVFIGMLIIQFTGKKRDFLNSKNWSFEWLLYNKNYNEKYNFLISIQQIALLLQISSFFILKAPVSVFFFQTIIIAFSSLTAYITLNKNQSKLTVYLLIIIITILCILLSLVNSPKWYFGLVIFIFLAFIYLNIINNITIRLFPKTAHSYKVYMFCWLLSIAIIPTISYYLSTKLNEEILSKREQMIHMADNVISLEKHNHEKNITNWHEDINGNVIDDIHIKFVEKNFTPLDSLNILYKDEMSNYIYPKADTIYRELPNLFSKNNLLAALQYTSNIHGNWLFTSDSLYYINTESKGMVKVKSERLNKMTTSLGVIGANLNNMGIWKWLTFLLIPIILLIIVIWSTFKHQAYYILNVILKEWDKPQNLNFINLIEDDTVLRIMLVSFDGDHLYAELEASDKFEIHPFLAEEFLYKRKKMPVDNRFNVVRIKGLENYIFQNKESELVLSRLQELNEYEHTKIVFELPFDIDYIKEYYEEYIAAFNLKEEDEIQIINLVRGLNRELKSYFQYTASIRDEQIQDLLAMAKCKSKYLKCSDHEKIANTSLLMKIKYQNIWNNLCRAEKLILFDLADDGMLNLKAKQTINKLVKRGLINISSTPSLFDTSFRYFLKHSIKEEETKLLEQSLGKQGRWKHAKYMLLFLLIPLAAFMFISQGFSIEKIVGILTGVIALFSGTMRVIDSGWFSKVTK